MMAWANAGNISGEATGASSNTSIEAMRGFKPVLSLATRRRQNQSHTLIAGSEMLTDRQAVFPLQTNIQNCNHTSFSRQKSV